MSPRLPGLLATTCCDCMIWDGFSDVKRFNRFLVDFEPPESPYKAHVRRTYLHMCLLRSSVAGVEPKIVRLGVQILTNWVEFDFINGERCFILFLCIALRFRRRAQRSLTIINNDRGLTRRDPTGPTKMSSLIKSTRSVDREELFLRYRTIGSKLVITRGRKPVLRPAISRWTPSLRYGRH